MCAGVLSLQAPMETRGQHCLPGLLSALLLSRRIYIYLCFLSVYICSNTASQRKTSGVPFLNPSPTRISALHFPPTGPASTQQPIHFYRVFFFFKSPTKGKINKWAKLFVITAPENFEKPHQAGNNRWNPPSPGGTYSEETSDVALTGCQTGHAGKLLTHQPTRSLSIHLISSEPFKYL